MISSVINRQTKTASTIAMTTITSIHQQCDGNEAKCIEIESQPIISLILNHCGRNVVVTLSTFHSQFRSDLSVVLSICL